MTGQRSGTTPEPPVHFIQSVFILIVIQDLLALRPGILDLRLGTRTDIAADVDHVDGIRHIDLPLVHIVQHLLGPLGPDFFIARMAKEPDADNDVALESQLLLNLKKLFLEARAAAEGYDRVFTNH